VGDDQLGFVHRQPLVAQGMAATLALLKGSGELRKADQLAGRAKDSRQYDPSNTDLGIKLEYRDEFGRKLTQKEAFRQLSYKFHGYGPSQKKKEKRLKVTVAITVVGGCLQ
jgi:U4/U6.U5 tri-snRNP-associated protein 1